MKCVNCQQSYSAAWGQPSPGGSSAPGYFLLIAAVLFGAALVLDQIGQRIWMWVCVVGGGFVGLQTLIAWHDVARGPYSGGKCPGCGHVNPIWLWSF